MDLRVYYSVLYYINCMYFSIVVWRKGSYYDTIKVSIDRQAYYKSMSLGLNINIKKEIMYIVLRTPSLD